MTGLFAQRCPKNLLKLCVLFHFLAISSYGAEKTTSCADKISSYIFIGGNYTYVNFAPKGHSSFHGNLGGAQISYEYRPGNSIYEGANFTWREGVMHGTSGKRDLLDFNTQVRLGYTFALGCEKILITPFTGFGWRYLGHNLKQSGEPSLKFYYNEVYIPIGLLTDYNITPAFSMGLSATWMPQVFPNVNIQPIGNTRWVLEDTLANVLIELALTYHFTRKKVIWSLNLKPFFEYWQDGKTLAETTSKIALDLPGNTYRFWGVELNVGCFF